MILELEQWYLGYAQILTDCRHGESGNGSVLILAHLDVDAMASARILSYMLRQDNVPYQLVPCPSYSKLEAILAQTVPLSGSSSDNDNNDNNSDNNHVRAVVCLNVGATRNLTALFANQTLHGTSVKIYVLDCRRPVHLANVHAVENVVVFWDSVQNDDVPSDGDDLSGNEDSPDDEEEEEEEELDEDDDDEEEEFLDDQGEQEFLYDNDNDDNDNNLDTRDATPSSTGHVDTDTPGLHSPGPSKRVKTHDPTTIDDPNAIDEFHTTDTTDTPSTPTAHATLTPRELHHDRRNRLRLYYSTGTFYGSPASYVAYRIATQLRFGDVGDLLWLACVGVTDAYLHARVDVAGYSALAIDLRSDCHRLFPNDMYSRVGNAVYAEHLTTGNAHDENNPDDLYRNNSNNKSSNNHNTNIASSNNPQGQTLTKIGFSENGRVLSETDFRFFLLRHTSLLDAMIYSDFIATRFQLSTSQGMHKLQELLAKMGYPLEECKQPFAFMKPSLRRRLQSQIREHAEEYGLENFEFTSFFRVTGYQSLLSASDTSYAVTALLECDVPRADATEDERTRQAFNVAYDALNSNAAPTVGLQGLLGAEQGTNVSSLVNGGNLGASHGGIGAGLRLAMSLQRTIMSTAASLIERNALTRLSHFRYAYINCTSQGEHAMGQDEVVPEEQTGGGDETPDRHHVFAKPLALTRLAHYLMDLHRENGKWTGAKSRPLILLAEQPRTKSYLVVGFEYPELAGSFVKNRFGKNFELAAQSMKGTFRFDSFDSNVVEVAAVDVQRFVEQLHYLMDSL
jgi:cell division control protein 45